MFDHIKAIFDSWTDGDKIAGTVGAVSIYFANLVFMDTALYAFKVASGLVLSFIGAALAVLGKHFGEWGSAKIKSKYASWTESRKKKAA